MPDRRADQPSVHSHPPWQATEPRLGAPDPDPPDRLEHAPYPDDGGLTWLGFAAAVTGRLWLSLVTGMLLIATLPGLLPGWSAHVVVSDSMAPRINTGDVVLSQHRDDYQPGQVIVFDDGSRGAVTHRVDSVEGDTYRTRGDANPTVDNSPVAADDVVGLGRVLVMFAGLPWVWYHTGQWLPLALFVLSLLLAAWAVARDRPSAGQPAQQSGDAHDERPDDPAGPPPSAPNTQDPMAGAEPDTPDPDPPAAGAVSPSVPGTGAVDRAGGARRWLPPAALLVVVMALLVSSLPSASARFTAVTDNPANEWRSTIFATYQATVLADNPYLYLRLNEAQPGNVATLNAANLGSSASAHQYTRASSGTFAQSFTLGSASSANLTPTPNTSSNVLRDTACILPPSTLAAQANPRAFSIEAWILSTGSAGGKIIGFESSRTGTSSQYDRHLYQDSQGYVHFGIYNNNATALTIRSATPLNDGNWHHVMGTLSGAGGTMRLYVDGAEAPGSPVANVTAETFTGWWRVGCGNLSGWPTGTPALTGLQSFIGRIDEPAAYPSALTAADAAERWAIGKP
jgi:signal peptidase I